MLLPELTLRFLSSLLAFNVEVALFSRGSNCDELQDDGKGGTD